MTVAQAIESEIQTAFNFPQHASAKAALMARLAGGYGTTNIYVAGYQLVRGVLPAFNNQAYASRVANFEYALYQSLVQQAYATLALARTNPTQYQLDIFNSAVRQLATWLASNPPPGVQWIFVNDGSAAPRLAVVVNSTTIYPPNLVVSLPALFGTDSRWADAIITWDLSAYIWSYPNESLFIDTFAGLF